MRPALALAVSLALAACARVEAAQGGAFADLDVVSGNGWYRAEVRRAPGYESKPPARSRWSVTVVVLVGSDAGEALWSSPLAWDGSPRHWRLSDDGTTLVHVREHFQDYRAVVEVLREGRPVRGPAGDTFDLDPDAVERTRDGKLWLADGGVPDGTLWLETDAGPRLALRLVLRDGAERLVDLAEGRVLGAEDFGRLATARVEPALPERLVHLVRAPYVRGFSVPGLVRAGHAVPVDVSADHPTPGWRFEGFLLEQGGELGRDLTLTPQSRGPVNQGALPQSLVPFRPTARLRGLPPAHYRLRVLGRATPAPEWAAFEVLPADHLLALERSGGLLGVSERFDVLGRGEVWRHADGATTRHRLPPDVEARAVEIADRLGAGRGRRASPGADRVGYRLTRWEGPLPVVLELDDGTAGPDVHELAALLDGLR